MQTRFADTDFASDFSTFFTLFAHELLAIFVSLLLLAFIA